MNSNLDHLPQGKRLELGRIVEILFAEFDDATKHKQIATRKMGRILKVVLFGSYARGNWVDDRKSGYRSDYDLLVVVNQEELTDLEYWGAADEHLLREYETTHTLTAPANFIVHSLSDVNDQLKKGRPFFVDIVRDGITLYEASDHPFATPGALSDKERRHEAEAYFAEWFSSTGRFLQYGLDGVEKGWPKEAAFLLHQATERLYHCILLTFTLYSPKSHNLNFLRSQAERLSPSLIEAWPRTNRLERRSWDLLRRAYVEARYSRQYEITSDELTWLSERVGVLRGFVEGACRERLAD